MSEPADAGFAQQQRRRHLDVADAALAEIARLHAQIGHLVHAEPEAELAQRREAFGFQRPHGAQRALPHFQHERRGERAVGVHELQDFRKQLRIVQRGCGDVAEQADLAVLELQAAHHLHAAEQQQLVDPRHQPAGFGRFEEIRRLQHVAFARCAAA